MDGKKASNGRWFNRNVFAFGLTSFLSDFFHEMATSVLPQFMQAIGFSAPALVSAPIVFLLLLGGKVISKIFGLYPVIGQFRRRRDERWYYTLMMSTGLTFGTISALYGFSHNIVTQEQYSFLVAVVIVSAVVPNKMTIDR